MATTYDSVIDAVTDPEPFLAASVRVHAPQVLAALIRRYGSFADCEDAVQQALVAAGRQWHRDGIPDDPAAWLATVARAG